MPRWLSTLTTAVEHIVLAPAAIALTLLAHWPAFVPLRKGLLPFLISRTVVSGNGRVCPDGSFQIASKASGMQAANGTGIFRMRSIFSFGPQFKALTLFAIGPTRKFPSLLDRRRALQISLSDSNLCEEAEYIRIGSAMLVIDAVEAGYPIPVPTLRHPIAALRQIIADPTLKTRVATTDGRTMAAIEIQRIYLDACRKFVESRPTAPGDAIEILRRWESVLDDLESAPEKLIGRLDWVTKNGCSTPPAPMPPPKPARKSTSATTNSPPTATSSSSAPPAQSPPSSPKVKSKSSC